MGNPVMFVVEVGSVVTTVLLIRDDSPPGRVRLQPADHALAVVHGAVRELRRSHGRRPRQGPGRHAAQSTLGDDGQPHAAGRQRSKQLPASKLRAGDVVLVSRRRIHSGRRRSHRRRRVGGRIGHHRRIRAGDPRSRRRPLGCDRRHARALRPDQSQDHLESRAKHFSIA